MNANSLPLPTHNCLVNFRSGCVKESKLCPLLPCVWNVSSPITERQHMCILFLCITVPFNQVIIWRQGTGPVFSCHEFGEMCGADKYIRLSDGWINSSYYFFHTSTRHFHCWNWLGVFWRYCSLNRHGIDIFISCNLMSTDLLMYKKNWSMSSFYVKEGVGMRKQNMGMHKDSQFQFAQKENQNPNANIWMKPDIL